MMRKDGFTLIELLVTSVVLGIMVAIAIPGFSSWLPNYRLKGAAREVYSNMQLARLGAIRGNTDWAIVFDAGVTPGRYFICSDDGANDTWDGPPAVGGDDVAEKTVDLADYGNSVSYGHGSATTPIDTTFGDDITYTPPDNVAVFNPRGTGSNGYVYLQNNKNTTTYGVGTLNSGVVRLLKWNSSTSKWE